MINKKRVFLVSELFYPEESSTAHILTDLANELSQPFDVTVLTGPEYYEASSNSARTKCERSKVTIERTWIPNLDKNKLVSRVFRLLALSIGLGWQTFTKAGCNDIVFAVTNPAPLLVTLALIARIRKFTLVFLVHDVFPENAVATGMISNKKVYYSLIKRVFDWAYGVADSVIAIGRDMAEVVAQKMPNREGRITVIENWADSPLIDLIPRESSKIKNWGLSKKIVIQYAGNIGRAQGILEFVDAISNVDNHSVHYVFCGAGALTRQLADKTKDCPDFTLAGPYPRTDQSLVLGSCDVALVILATGMYGLGVPSKTYNIMAAGKPILFLGPKDSEVYRLVNDNKIGWAFDWDDLERMVALINSMSVAQIDSYVEMGRRARLLVETRYTEAIQVKKFRDLFESFQTSGY